MHSNSESKFIIADKAYKDWPPPLGTTCLVPALPTVMV